MGSSNWPLIAWYVFWAVLGGAIYKKKRWLGALAGLVAALILITILAFLIGGQKKKRKKEKREKNKKLNYSASAL